MFTAQFSNNYFYVGERETDNGFNCMRGKEGEGVRERELQAGVSKVSEPVVRCPWCVRCQDLQPLWQPSLFGFTLHLTSRKDRAVFKVDDCICSSTMLLTKWSYAFIFLRKICCFFLSFLFSLFKKFFIFLLSTVWVLFYFFACNLLLRHLRVPAHLICLQNIHQVALLKFSCFAECSSEATPFLGEYTVLDERQNRWTCVMYINMVSIIAYNSVFITANFKALSISLLK